ncbi:MAG: DMT family transporter, partial [Pseudomonadota bacterium]
SLVNTTKPAAKMITAPTQVNTSGICWKNAGTVAQLLLTEALKQADATVVMPFDFLKLVWASLFGAAFFQQIPDVFTWVGAIIIFAAGFVVLTSEKTATEKK